MPYAKPVRDSDGRWQTPAWRPPTEDEYQTFKATLLTRWLHPRYYRPAFGALVVCVHEGCRFTTHVHNFDDQILHLKVHHPMMFISEKPTKEDTR